MQCLLEHKNIKFSTFSATPEKKWIGKVIFRNESKILKTKIEIFYSHSGLVYGKNIESSPLLSQQ
jgi:hypothetical protein